MMASALFMRSGVDKLAHDSIQVPFSFLFLLALYNLSEFQKESYIEAIFFSSPVIF